MLQIIDQIREYAAKRNPTPVVRESYFAYNEQTGQWITSNEESANAMLLLQFVQANTVGANTTWSIICQWIYAIQVGDNAIRPYQQQALFELQRLEHYLAGDVGNLGRAYQIAGARYTLIHTERPYIAAGATAELTLLGKDLFFECCKDLPPQPEIPICPVGCPVFDLDISESIASDLGADFVAPNVVPQVLPSDPAQYQSVVLGFRVPNGNLQQPSDVPDVASLHYVDSDGNTQALGFTGGAILDPTAYYVIIGSNQIASSGRIFLVYEGCELITINIPTP